jgi:dTMP kinase
MTHAHFISFEGGDGCGKSTQLKLAAAWLREQGVQVLETRQPGATTLGVELRRLLLSGEYVPVAECELLLFLADRAQHVKEVIQPALDNGEWVLCDRYSDSTLAYQLAARGLAKHVDLQPMLAFAEAGCVPDKTFWLDVSAEEALRRVKSRTDMGEESTRIDEETLSFHQQVHAGFAEIYRQNMARIHRLNAMESIDALHLDIRQQLQGMLVKDV